MVRLSDLSPDDRAHLLGKSCHRLEPPAWVSAPDVPNARVAIVTTAGVRTKRDDAFALRTADYRLIPADTPAADITMSHASTNFDRTGFFEDINVVFPLQRLHEMAADRAIGSVAALHYSFMGAFLEPAAYRSTATDVAQALRGDNVDVAFLIPV